MDYVEAMIKARTSPLSYMRIVDEAADTGSPGALLPLLTSYGILISGMPINGRTGPKITKAAFCECISTRFPLSDEEMWCSDVTPRSECTVSKDTSLHPKTCATFFLGGFSIFLDGRASRRAFLGHRTCEYFFSYFKEHASPAVFARTVPLILIHRFESLRAADPHVLTTVKTVCEQYFSRSRAFSAHDVRELLACMRGSQLLRGALLGSLAAEVVADDPRAIESAAYLYEHMPAETHQAWMSRGAEAFQDSSPSVARILHAMFTIRDNATSPYYARARETFVQMCTWVPKENREHFRQQIQSRVEEKLLVPGTALHDMCMECISVLQPAVKSAHCDSAAPTNTAE